MKKTLQTVLSFLVAFAMVAAPVADAQTRGRQGSGQTSGNRPTSGSTSRPGNSGGASTRPSTGTTRPSTPTNGTTHRPGTNTNNVNNRPSTGNQGNNRPGGNTNHNRPATPARPGGNTGNFRPSTPPAGPSNWNRPANNAHRPGNGYVHPGNNRPTPPPPPRPHAPAYRHPVPFFGAFHRPVPPPRWHYTGGGPVFGTILGVALGTALGVSLTSLANSGYTVSSYGNDVVYLSNVPQMNYTWPDAALYYNNGVLTGSQFTYTSPYYDMSRYNNLYNVFTSQYGLPVQSVNQGGIISTTWYGPANRYVSLSFNSQYGGNYYTTLSFGN